MLIKFARNCWKWIWEITQEMRQVREKTGAHTKEIAHFLTCIQAHTNIQDI